MKNSLVSAIVPIYKAEKFVHNCIDSLLAQTYTNIEVILVDDGSPDNCGKICEEYAAKDKRVKVIHQQNAGASAARNTGMDHSKGERITFVDADDKVTDEFIETLMSKEGDWIIGGYRDTNNNFCLLKEDYYSGKDSLEQYFQEHQKYLYSNTIWGKLYSSSIINKYNIKFNSCLRFSEDLIFNLSYLRYCNTISLSSTTNYIYTADRCMEEKYRLTLQELSDILEQITERTKALSENWGTDVRCEKSIRVNIAMYPMMQIFHNSCEYENLYAKYVLGEKDSRFYVKLYSDNICSPAIRGIRLAKMYLKTGHFCKAINMMHKIKNAYGGIIPSLHLTRYDRVVAFLCRYCY